MEKAVGLIISLGYVLQTLDKSLAGIFVGTKLQLKPAGLESLQTESCVACQWLDHFSTSTPGCPVSQATPPHGWSSCFFD